MKWATRENIHVDRAASAWLISRYVDPDAEFVYVQDLHGVPHDATPFDMPGCQFSHHGNDVTFETILRHFELHDPILWRIGEIVHQADLADDIFDAPEADGFDVMIRALGVDHDDESIRRTVATIMTSLEQYLRREFIDAPH